MPPDVRLPVVLCWHMHQPEYRDLASGEFQQPWVYLHAIKDYADMAAHLEQCPAARAVVNFAPVLLDQIDAYVADLAAWRATATPPRDALLAALAASRLPAGAARAHLLASCLRVHHARMVAPHPAYASLHVLAASAAREDAAHWLSDACLFDLLTWYHLAWLGSTVRAGAPVARALMAQGRDFSPADRHALLALVHDTLAGLAPRYRALAARGQVELAVSPYAHPILPLLLDFASAREALPGAVLPQAAVYPGGAARVAWHLEHARAVGERWFGELPQGCWPSEGAVSAAALSAIAAAGFRWAATGHGVTAASCRRAGLDEQAHRAFRDAASGLVLFARDDTLSDRIGFVYSEWDAAAAVDDLEQAMLAVADQATPGASVLAIVMDGENAWEHYADNAAPFLGTLYARLAGHPRLRLATFGELATELELLPLPPLVAGSWVYGSLSTWIGERAKNRLWDRLVAARAASAAAPAAAAALCA
ncbi:MAG: glycoside hydrolase family 57 protein, partial [Gammaproteobacteria bacterium]